MKEVTVSELKKMIDTEEDFQLIDVREENEVTIASIGGQLIPMGDVMDNLDKISKEKKVVVYCRSGNRSGVITQALETRGFKNIHNLKGGILAWATEIDTAVTKY
ncbi:MAG: rhodanese-like domain-containing protein [Bacteroidetes bacterium]|nr:MAG: rhodanese-like domain-containing protein [Bacteroidota bacterium]